MNTFDEARKYFEKFVQNHSREYFESMKEYGSRSYGEFINSSEIIQTSRDIAHNLREEFCDLEIGNHFVSPKHLIDTVKNLKNYLQSKDAVSKRRSITILSVKDRFHCLFPALKSCVRNNRSLQPFFEISGRGAAEGSGTGAKECP